MKSKPAVCRCRAYEFPHRAGGGLCRWPDPPNEVWQGEPGKSQPVELRRRGVRRTLCQENHLHPIRDRALIAELLPVLYAEYYEDIGR